MYRLCNDLANASSAAMFALADDVDVDFGLAGLCLATFVFPTFAPGGEFLAGRFLLALSWDGFFAELVDLLDFALE